MGSAVPDETPKALIPRTEPHPVAPSGGGRGGKWTAAAPADDGLDWHRYWRSVRATSGGSCCWRSSAPARDVRHTPAAARYLAQGHDLDPNSTDQKLHWYSRRDRQQRSTAARRSAASCSPRPGWPRSGGPARWKRFSAAMSASRRSRASSTVPLGNRLQLAPARVDLRRQRRFPRPQIADQPLPRGGDRAVLELVSRHRAVCGTVGWLAVYDRRKRAQIGRAWWSVPATPVSGRGLCTLPMKASASSGCSRVPLCRNARLIASRSRRSCAHFHAQR